MLLVSHLGKKRKKYSDKMNIFLRIKFEKTGRGVHKHCPLLITYRPLFNDDVMMFFFFLLLVHAQDEGHPLISAAASFFLML